jgi:hypothetical protein
LDFPKFNLCHLVLYQHSPEVFLRQPEFHVNAQRLTMPQFLFSPWVLILTLLAIFVHSRSANNEQIIFSSPPTDTAENPEPLRFAVFGDSWASGVNYGSPSEEVEYNFPDSDEVCRCRRVNEAWGVQLLHDEDISWTGGNRPLELDFQACHGAVFNDIPDQVRRLDQEKAPEFGFMMIGGNPGGRLIVVLGLMQD